MRRRTRTPVGREAWIFGALAVLVFAAVSATAHAHDTEAHSDGCAACHPGSGASLTAAPPTVAIGPAHGHVPEAPITAAALLASRRADPIRGPPQR